MLSRIIKMGSVILLATLPMFGSAESIQAAIAGEHRSEASSARDEARHPAETLAFFGFKPTDKVIEISPGGGWYTEILAPALYQNGELYAAHFPAQTDVPYYQRSRQAFLEKLAAEPSVYDKVKVTEFIPGNPAAAGPLGGADKVLTFRNVHNWIKAGSGEQAFVDFYAMLAKGGVLGVVEHRAKAGTTLEAMKVSGYVTEAEVIRLAEKAGFVLDAKSEVNANAKDTANHPKGVWTLPPSLALQDEDKDKYLAIGESDRMTLRFRKPE
ncbi:methyltransferase [Simiduia curdlanivorans]|uniref:Class I SAM-dependent methyltransferase n=1 Tax=Simiduia curdlanivorans TaxID=1492769 RepID=A0ABV8V242_9GAMM|nr:methyltransferase [Simiduia curdlanivorans]MDN3640170.1 methyltransferase [Simiduia curdlanivorans]